MKIIRQCVLLLTVLALLAALPALSPSAAAASNVAASAAAVNAEPMQSAVLIDGQAQKFEAYCMGGSNYFKLRDIAFALNGTARQFQVAFNSTLGRIELTSHTAYTAVGGEMAVPFSRENVSAKPASFDVCLGGVKLSLASYLIGSSVYVRLRDLAAALDFGIRYTAASNTIEIDTASGYTPDPNEITFPCDLSVVFIGDSIGASVGPYLKTYFPNAYVDAKASRQFYQAKAIIQALLQKNKLSSTVVIELGTNGTVKEADLRALIELIGSDRKIVFVNCQVPRSWCEGDNKTFTKVIPEYANTAIADWYSASLDQSGYFYEDGVHPNKKGVSVMAKVIAEAVVKIQPYKP